MQIPSSWKDITIGQYQDGYIVLKDQYEDEADRQAELLAALTGAPVEAVYRMRRDAFYEAVKQCSFILQDPGKSLSTKFPKYFMCGGRVFWVLQRVDKMTGGQFVDYMSFIKGNADDNIANMNNLMAVLCHQGLFGKYDGKGLRARAEFLRNNMPMSTAFAISLFFSNLWNVSFPRIVDSLESQLKEMQMMAERKN